MQNNMARWYQVMALLTVGSAITVVNGGDIPSKADRDKADTELKSKEDDFRHRSVSVDDGTKLRMNLTKSIEALQKTYTPLAKEADDLTALANKRMEEAKASTANKDAMKSAALLKEQANAMQIEIQKMQVTLETLQKLKERADQQSDMDQKEVNRLKLDVQKALLTYFHTADPAMIAQRYGVPLDISFSFNATEFMKVTNGGDPKNWLSRYGLVAEHTWDDRFTYADKDGRHTITLKGIAQHEQCTTRDMFDMATKLLQTKTPGVKAPVGRFGLTVNWGHYKHDTDAFKGVYAHPVDAFRPSVLSNSTGAWSPLSDMDAFRELVDGHTKGEDTVTFKAANGTISYGLPPMGRPILANASGNSGYGFVPDNTNAQHFYPNHVNIGTVTIPLNKDGMRDDKAFREVESYSTSNAGVHAVVQRPRYNPDGSEIVFQYLNPNFEKTLEENLWKLAGKPGTPTPEQLTDEKAYPPELVKAIAHDKAAFLKVILRNEGVDEKGQTKNLRGTSFACPTAAGILMAARLYFPTASEPEIIDAFCSSCVPITHRRNVDALGREAELLDDVPWITNAKSGYAYSPMVGFGEFLVDPNATKENPDSWMRMTTRLELMQKAREKMPTTTVTVGSGTEKRTVTLNGQPAAATLEIKQFSEVVSDAEKQRLTAQDKAIVEAFTLADKAHGTSAMKNAELGKLLKQRQYAQALELLKKETSKSVMPVLDALTPITSLPSAMAIPAEALVRSDALKNAEKLVAEAEKLSQHTYSFQALSSQDMCCTMAAIRLQFKDMGKTDDFVILESPDGTRIPIIMSSSSDWQGVPTGVSVASTPGVMRKSAAGTWKIYTRQELDPAGTELILSGTERNVGLNIIDVRESILPGLELADAKARTAIAEKNQLTIADPHKHLRVMNGLEGGKSMKAENPTQISPSSRQKFQDYFEELINGSHTIETLKKSGHTAPADNGHIEKVSFNEAAMPDRALGVAIASMASQLNNLLTDASMPMADDRLRDSWGYLASAMVNAPDAAKDQAKPDIGGHSANARKKVMIPEGMGYMALLKKHKGDVPPWWHENQVAQVEASRRAMGGNGRKA